MWMSMTGFGRGDHNGGGGPAVRLTHGLLPSFLAEGSRLREEYALTMDLSFRDLIGVPDLFVFAPEGDDPAEKHWALAEGAVRHALAMLVGSRQEGGERVRSAIGESVRTLRDLTEEIVSLAGEDRGISRSP